MSNRMFKYPSPWQVLCSSLERREQVPENGEDESCNLDKSTEQYVRDSEAFHKENSTEFQIVNTTDTLVHKDLESEGTKISNLSEGEPEITAKSAHVVHEIDINADSNKLYIPDEEGENLTDLQINTAASESTMDRVTRRMFSSISINGSQQDLSSYTEENQETEKIDKGKDVWIPPPDRRLKLLREEERFEIRSHLPETSPTKLFVDSDEDDNSYKVKPQSRELTPEKVIELEKNRRDIIKKQAQRKSLDAEDVIDMRDTSNTPNSNIELSRAEDIQNKPNILTDQIHFESARQQFLKLEKEKNSLPITPNPQPRQSRITASSLHENDKATKEQIEEESKSHIDDYVVTQNSSSNLRKQFFKTLSLDFVDRGELEKSAEKIEEENETIPNPTDETPIEREIRLALQREENLRKERGIVRETKEIIEISKNPLLAISPDMLHSQKSKNRLSTSVFIQREIEKEVQREDDLKNEGRVAGLYDKGNSQELDVRRKLFEQPDVIPVQPQPGSSTKTIKKEAKCKTQAGLEADDDTKNSTGFNSPQPYSVRMKWKPAPFNAYRTRRLSADNILDIKTPIEKPLEIESSDETFVLRKENFYIQPFNVRLRFQESDGKDERDHSIGHKERYNTWLKPSLSNIIEQEIQQTLQRDREIQEERRKSGLPPLSIHNDNEENTTHNGFDAQGTSSVTSSVSHTSSAPWKGTLGNKTPSHDSSSVNIFTPERHPKFEVFEDRHKRHESRKSNLENVLVSMETRVTSHVGGVTNVIMPNDSSQMTATPWFPYKQYAGIDPSDAVNTEIVESTRVNRHKNTMALRWEAGLYANEQSD